MIIIAKANSCYMFVNYADVGSKINCIKKINNYA